MSLMRMRSAIVAALFAATGCLAVNCSAVEMLNGSTPAPAMLRPDASPWRRRRHALRGLA